MEIKINTVEEYIPEWNDNRSEEKPMKVIHRIPTWKLRSNLLPNPKITMKISPNGEAQGGETIVEMNNEKVIRGMTKSFVDFTLNVNGNIYEIKTVEDLFNESTPTIIGGLVDELGSYYQRILSQRTETKN